MSKQDLLKALQSVENMHDYMAEQRTQTIITDIRASIENGITLRDQFAMAALTGYMALPDERTYNPNREDCRDKTVDEWQEEMALKDARYCYQMADAMLKARGEYEQRD